jgi:hypothetical protein
MIKNKHSEDKIIAPLSLESLGFNKENGCSISEIINEE